MDIATIVGFIAFATALMFGIGSHLELVIETPMLIMVFGGGLALTLIALPLQHVVGLAGVVARTLFTRVTVPTLLVESATHMAAMARAEGILALESKASETEDEFLSKSIQLAIDGTAPELIKDILTTEVAFMEDRHARGQGILSAMGASAPAFFHFVRSH